MGPEQQQRPETLRTGAGKGNVCIDKPEKICIHSTVTLGSPRAFSFYIL